MRLISYYKIKQRILQQNLSKYYRFESADTLCKQLKKCINAISLRDEIGTCLNIGVEIDVTNKVLFFIIPYQVKKEDKNIADKEMKRLCYLGILKEGFSTYSSPVMSISRTFTKDKIGITDFKHLNIRIAKNNLVYPLLKDTFSVLGSS